MIIKTYDLYYKIIISHYDYNTFTLHVFKPQSILDLCELKFFEEKIMDMYLSLKEDLIL
jgi:hypothetical protein